MLDIWTKFFQVQTVVSFAGNWVAALDSRCLWSIGEKVNSAVDEKQAEDFPGGTVDKNIPASAGGTVGSLVGRFHMPTKLVCPSYTGVPQLLKPVHLEPGCAAREAPAMRSPLSPS